jgi:hypothetical protein
VGYLAEMILFLTSRNINPSCRLSYLLFTGLVRGSIYNQRDAIESRCNRLEMVARAFYSRCGWWHDHRIDFLCSLASPFKFFFSLVDLCIDPS